MMLRQAAAVTALALGVLSGTAEAAVLEVTSQTIFESLTGLKRNSFAGFPATPQHETSPFTYGSLTLKTSGEINEYNDGGYGSGVNYLGTVPAGSSSSIADMISFRRGVTEVGFTIGTYLESEIVQVSVDGSAQAPVITPPGAPSTIFVGFISSTPVTSIDFATTGELDFVSYEGNFNVVPGVPLPASAPMFGAALVALGAVGYGPKRKSKAAAAA